MASLGPLSLPSGISPPAIIFWWHIYEILPFFANPCYENHIKNPAGVLLLDTDFATTGIQYPDMASYPDKYPAIDFSAKKMRKTASPNPCFHRDKFSHSGELLAGYLSYGSMTLKGFHISTL